MRESNFRGHRLRAVEGGASSNVADLMETKLRRKEAVLGETTLLWNRLFRATAPQRFERVRAGAESPDDVAEDLHVLSNEMMHLVLKHAGITREELEYFLKHGRLDTI